MLSRKKCIITCFGHQVAGSWAATIRRRRDDEQLRQRLAALNREAEARQMEAQAQAIHAGK